MNSRTQKRAFFRALLWASLGVTTVAGCKELEKRLFTRNSPEVDKAIAALEHHDAGVAARTLTEYLSTGPCKDGSLGTPQLVRDRPQASLDLGLTLFNIAEKFGEKFGTPPAAPAAAHPAQQNPQQLGAQGPAGPDPAMQQQAQALLAQRSAEVDCAQRIVRIIAADAAVDPELRAQAYYLSGNLEFLRHDYQSAVDSYDQALGWLPGGLSDGQSDIGTRAAWNRSIALRRIQEEEENKPDPPDAGTPPPSDGGSPSEDSDQKDDKKQDESDESKPQDEEQDSEEEQQNQDEDQEQKDQQKDQEQQNQDQEGKKDEQGKDQQPEPPPPQPSATAQPAASSDQPPPSLGQDERMLDQLERATVLPDPKFRGRRPPPPYEDK